MTRVKISLPLFRIACLFRLNEFLYHSFDDKMAV